MLSDNVSIIGSTMTNTVDPDEVAVLRAVTSASTVFATVFTMYSSAVTLFRSCMVTASSVELEIGKIFWVEFNVFCCPVELLH